MGTSCWNPADLKEMWTSWHDNVGSPMRADYAAAWSRSPMKARTSSAYAMSARCGGRNTTCRRKISRADRQALGPVKPLYDELHCYVRANLNREIWRRRPAQDRSDPRRPARQYVGAGMGQYLRHRGAAKARATSATTRPQLLKPRAMTPMKMVETGEGFYTSLGFAPLPETFWKRSHVPRSRATATSFAMPRAWDIDNGTICASRCASR